MTTFKYRFKINYQNDELKRLSDFMKKLDLGFDGLASEETWEFTGTEDSDITKMKERIVWSIEQCGGKVFSIEGGKWE